MSYNLRSKPKMRENKSKRNREDSDDDFTNSPPRAKMSRVGKSPRKSNMNDSASQNSKSKKKDGGKKSSFAKEKKFRNTASDSKYDEESEEDLVNKSGDEQETDDDMPDLIDTGRKKTPKSAKKESNTPTSAKKEPKAPASAKKEPKTPDAAKRSGDEGDWIYVGSAKNESKTPSSAKKEQTKTPTSAKKEQPQTPTSTKKEQPKTPTSAKNEPPQTPTSAKKESKYPDSAKKESKPSDSAKKENVNVDSAKNESNISDFAKNVGGTWGPRNPGTQSFDFVTTPPSNSTPIQSQSTTIRMKGNLEFKYSKGDGLNRNSRMSYVLKAITHYENALKSALDNLDRSKAAKNLAVSYDRLVQIEDREENKPKYYTHALNCYISSLQYGESAQDKKWTDEMFQKFSNLISELSSEKQAVFIFGTHQKICHSGYDKLACEIMLQYGEDLLPQALEYFGKKEYRSGLPLLREIYRPIEESKKYLRRLEYNEEEQSRVDLLEKDYCTFLNIGEALQSYSIGEELLAVELGKAESNPHHALDILDFFQRSMVLVKGEDAEIIAMDLSKVGIIYHCLLKNTIRAKEVFNESINLTSAMTEHGKLYSNPWYVEMTAVMQKIQEDAKKKEDEKWERKREVQVKKIKENGIYDKIWSCRYDNAKNMIEFFLKCFPLKHVQDLEKKKPKLEKDDGLNKKKRALLIVISWYHPDKVTSAKDADGNRIYDDEDIVIFEEITKCLNSQYENVKGCGPDTMPKYREPEPEPTPATPEEKSEEEENEGEEEDNAPNYDGQFEESESTDDASESSDDTSESTDDTFESCGDNFEPSSNTSESSDSDD